MGNYPNLEVREFSQSIINFINQSLLPDEVKYLVLSSITRDLEKASNTAINQEIAAREKEEKQRDEGGDEKVNKTYDHVDWEKYASNIPQPNESESNRNKMDVALDFPDDHPLDGEMKESE